MLKKKIKVELLPNGVVKSDWWTPEVRDLFCEICPKYGTKACDKLVCNVANPYCG